MAVPYRSSRTTVSDTTTAGLRGLERQSGVERFAEMIGANRITAGFAEPFRFQCPTRFRGSGGAVFGVGPRHVRSELSA